MIQFATLEDVKAIHHIVDTSLGYAYPLDEMRQQMKEVLQHPEHIVLVSKENNQVNGLLHACFYQSFYDEAAYNVLALCVVNNCKGKGIGSQLISTLEEKVKEKGVYKIRLNSGEQRTLAHQFYEKNGFISPKKQKMFYKKLK